MPRFSDLRESRFITQHEVDPPVLATIKRFEEINVAKPGAEPETRWCVWFKEMDKPMTLNSTNGQMLYIINGKDPNGDEDLTEFAIGTQLVLYRDPNISFGGRVMGGIRIRAPKAGFQSQNANVPQSVPPVDDSDIPF